MNEFAFYSMVIGLFEGFITGCSVGLIIISLLAIFLLKDGT